MATSLQLSIPQAFVGLFQPYRNKAFYGGRGSAKSHSFAEALAAISAHRTRRIVCARQYQNSIADSVKDLIEQKIQKLNIRDGFSITDKEIKHNSTGSRFSFIGLDRNPDSQKSLEGIDILWTEEAQSVNEKALEIIIPTVRKPGSELWWSWNPRYRTDPVDARFRGPEVPPRSLVVPVSFNDNPYFYTTELAGEMRFMRKHNPSRFEHVWGGGYDENGEARVFQNVRFGRVDVPEYCIPRFGLDFGFSSSPNALVKLYIIHEQNIIYVVQEAFGRVPTKQLADLLDTVHESRVYPIIADNARPEQIDYLAGEGFNIYAARKGPGSLQSGINWLQGFDIVIDPDCYNMREEARQYLWKLDPLGRPLPIPVDAYNHGWDAIRYACEDEFILNASDTDKGVVRLINHG